MLFLQNALNAVQNEECNTWMQNMHFAFSVSTCWLAQFMSSDNTVRGWLLLQNAACLDNVFCQTDVSEAANVPWQVLSPAYVILALPRISSLGI